jgi:hypothetical protein
MNTRPAQEHAVFTTAQLWRIRCEQRPSNKGELDSGDTEKLGRSTTTGGSAPDLIFVQFSEISHWLLVKCTPCTTQNNFAAVSTVYCVQITCRDPGTRFPCHSPEGSGGRRRACLCLPRFWMSSRVTAPPGSIVAAVGFGGRLRWGVGGVPGYQGQGGPCPLNIRSLSYTDSFCAVTCCSFCAARFLSTRLMEDTCNTTTTLGSGTAVLHQRLPVPLS